MGISYSNITIMNVDQAALVGYLKRTKRDAYVSPTVDNCTVVFDRAAEEGEDALLAIAMELSQWFGCAVLAVMVHDDDLFVYWLYENGTLKDRYDSSPSHFEASLPPMPPRGGDIEALCRAFQAPHARDILRDIFARAELAATDENWTDDELVGDEIHDVLAQALGLPLFAVHTGYNSVVHNDLPDDLPTDSLVYCGDARWV